MTDKPTNDNTADKIEDLDVDPKDAADVKGSAGTATGKHIPKAVLY